jgi:hypothetical protein
MGGTLSNGLFNGGTGSTKLFTGALFNAGRTRCCIDGDRKSGRGFDERLTTVTMGIYDFTQGMIGFQGA